MDSNQPPYYNDAVHDHTCGCFDGLLDVESWVEIDPTGWLPDFITDIEVSHERRWIEIFQMRLIMNEVGLKSGTTINSGNLI